MFLLYVLVRSLIQRLHCILIIVAIPLKSTLTVLLMVLVYTLSPNSHWINEIVALNAVHSWHDAWQDGAVALQLGGGLCLSDASVVQGVSSQVVELFACFHVWTELDGFWTIFEHVCLLQLVVVGLFREQYFIYFEKRLLVVHEQIEQIVSILSCEFGVLNPIFG